jgi:uncharacterized membrane protein
MKNNFITHFFTFALVICTSLSFDFEKNTLITVLIGSIFGFISRNDEIRKSHYFIKFKIIDVFVNFILPILIIGVVLTKNIDTIFLLSDAIMYYLIYHWMFIIFKSHKEI